MPRIFDNKAEDLLPALRPTLELSNRSDFYGAILIYMVGRPLMSVARRHATASAKFEI
jgi:hypothetical protein